MKTLIVSAKPKDIWVYVEGRKQLFHRVSSGDIIRRDKTLIEEPKRIVRERVTLILIRDILLIHKEKKMSDFFANFDEVLTNAGELRK